MRGFVLGMAAMGALCACGDDSSPASDAGRLVVDAGGGDAGGFDSGGGDATMDGGSMRDVSMDVVITDAGPADTSVLGDEVADALSPPQPCGSETCGAGQICVHPCCGGAAPPCYPPDDAGVCPPGTMPGACFPTGSGCTPPPCTPPPPHCAPLPPTCFGARYCECFRSTTSFSDCFGGLCVNGPNGPEYDCMCA